MTAPVANGLSNHERIKRTSSSKGAAFFAILNADWNIVAGLSLVCHNCHDLNNEVKVIDADFSRADETGRKFASACRVDPVRLGYGQVVQELPKGRPAFTATVPGSENQRRTG